MVMRLRSDFQYGDKIDVSELEREILKSLLNRQHYIVLETAYTKHHIEKLLFTCKDRGKWKWIAETKPNAWNGINNNDGEAQRSIIDSGDLFPRLFFRTESLITEIFCWLEERKLQVHDIKAPQL